MLLRDVWLTRPMVGQICALTKLHRRTVERWLECGRIPETAYRLLDILQNGRIEQIHADWTGWTIDARHGHLVTPVGECIRPGQILAVPYRYHELATVRRKLRRAEQLINDAALEKRATSSSFRQNLRNGG